VIGYFNESADRGTWLGGVYNDTLATWQWLNGEHWEFDFFNENYTNKYNHRLVFRNRESSPERNWNGAPPDADKYVLCEQRP